jgi:hypothetical protein
MPSQPSSAAPASPQRAPDFFVVGHPKSGTTALHAMLTSHPQIYMPTKEIWFLATEPGAPIPARPAGSGRTPQSLEEYLALFGQATPDQLVGDYSTSYLVSHFAAHRIAELQPGARIIALLREPASFLRSLHLQLLQNHTETEQSLRQAIDLEQDRREGRNLPRNGYWLQATQYSEHIRYVDQLRRYRALFDDQHLLVIIYEDYRRENEATLRKIQRFLQIDHTQPIATTDANPSVRVRAQRLHELIHTVAEGQGPVTRAVRSAVSAAAPRAISRQSAVAIRDRIFLSSPPPPDERLMSDLRRRFKPEVVALSEYLDRDLVTLWGYGDLS